MPIGTGYDVGAPKRSVNMTLNEDLVRVAKGLSGNLSAQVKKLLAGYVEAEQKRRAEDDERLRHTLNFWNEFDTKHGSFADEYKDL